MSVNTMRFTDILPTNRVTPQSVFILGCGTIGSPVADTLIRMGIPHVGLCDHDMVEEPNIATQLFTPDDIGTSKVMALAQRLARVNPALRIDTYPTRVTQTSCPPLFRFTVSIAATDNVESRRLLHQRWTQTAQPGSLFIDPRMGLEEFECYTDLYSAPNHRYRDWLHDSAQEFNDAPCSARAIPYTGRFAAAVLGSLLRKYMTGDSLPTMLRADLGMFTTTAYWAGSAR